MMGVLPVARYEVKPHCSSDLHFSLNFWCWSSSQTMLNTSGHPCLVPDLRGNAFSFSQLRVMVALALSYTAFIMLRKRPSMMTLWGVFIINWCWFLSKPLLCLLRWSFRFYSSVCWCGISYWLTGRYWRMLAPPPGFPNISGSQSTPRAAGAVIGDCFWVG